MRRTVLVLALGALLAIAGSTAAFAAVPTTLTAKYTASTEFFHGSVKSTNAECRAGRVVKIYKQKPGTDSLQGKTMSKANGTWRIEVMHAHGRYYAVAPKHKGMHATCAADRSPIVDVM